MEDDALELRLSLARRRVAEQAERLRQVRRRLREMTAAASASSDRVTARLLQAKGHPSPEPPVPPHPPAWLDAGPAP